MWMNENLLGQKLIMLLQKTRFIWPTTSLCKYLYKPQAKYFNRAFTAIILFHEE